MTQQEIIQLAESGGFYKNHFIRMKDKKSGVVIAGVFTKFKQHGTEDLRIKNDNTEVQIITNGELNFEILQSTKINSN